MKYPDRTITVFGNRGDRQDNPAIVTEDLD